MHKQAAIKARKLLHSELGIEATNPNNNNTNANTNANTDNTIDGSSSGSSSSSSSSGFGSSGTNSAAVVNENHYDISYVIKEDIRESIV